MNKKIAFFVDGGYFTRRIDFFLRKYFAGSSLTPEQVISILYYLVNRHKQHVSRDELYRIYYYDAPPFEDQMREPVPQEGKQGLSTKAFKKDPKTIFQKELHSSLGQCRKLALRMGQLSNSKRWLMTEFAQKRLLSGALTVDQLKPADFFLDIQQKGVDTRIGIDISTLTFRKFADTIVLFASDADFVPAAKLARTHGVDVMLDPLYGNVASDLSLHVDGIKSFDIVSAISRCIGMAPNPAPDWWKMAQGDLELKEV
ncbi:NYN domain-containing protein [Photobacterium indicum]|uniref:NYN domain-containing protein n=1 Tax=Photobacterium indicum TaxID=81447 RepID=UPI003D0C863F